MKHARSSRATALPSPAFSLPDRAPERRGDERLFTLFRTGKLISKAGETLCRVRNISPRGFMADVCPAPGAGEPVALEICEGRPHAARVAWTEAGRFGAEFLETRSVSDLIGDSVRSPNHRHRAIRIAPEGAFATILHEGRLMRAAIINISQTGAAIFAYDLPLTAATRRDVTIEIDGLDPLAGLLCWASNGAAGIQFEQPLSFETFSHWLWAAALAGHEVRPMH